MDKNMKNITRMTLAVLCAALTGMGCTSDFQEINWPHGGVTEEELDRDNNLHGSMLPAIELLVVPMSDSHAFQHCENLIGDVAGRMLMCIPKNANWTRNFSYFTWEHDGWVDTPFNTVMGFYTSYTDICDFTEQDVNNSIYAIARILRVAVMHRLADTYGPIPYSAYDPSNLVFTLPYDDDDEVYLTMLSDLDEAIGDLNDCIATDRLVDITNFDRIYGGNYSQWLKYANSLMLRLAVRVSNAAPDKTREYAQKAIAGGVIESNNDNAEMHMSIGNLANISSQLHQVQQWGDTYACADLLCYMNGYEDPRRAAYFEKPKNADAFVGLRAGCDIEKSAVDDNYSLPKVGPRDDYPLLTAAEVAFLRAECVLNGWTEDTQSAEEFYKSGIRLSFTQWDISGAEEYINSEKAPERYVDVNNQNAEAPSDITVKWNEGDTQAKKLQRIITQKYIALYPLGHETWCDYRRTGYPSFMPVGNAAVPSEYSGQTVISRVVFPISESKNNATNYYDAIGKLDNGENSLKTRLWWAKK